MSHIAETSVLLDLLVRALVAHKSAVKIGVFPSGDQTTFQVQVDPKDRGKLIGKQGRTARSLRILLNAIGREVGSVYTLDLEDHPSSENRHQSRELHDHYV